MKQTMATLVFLLLPAPVSAAEDPTSTIRNFYAAISRGDFRSAYAAWDQNGRASHQNYDAFRHGFARTSKVRVSPGSPFDREGAAGSIYVTVPVEVDATLKSGTRQHFAGSYTLRAVDDLPGASSGAGRWRLFSADLRHAR